MQYKMSKSDLTSTTLWLSVWSRDRFSANLLLGEAYLPLSSLDLDCIQDQWYKLQGRVSVLIVHVVVMSGRYYPG